MDLKIANFGNLPRGSFVGRKEVKYSIFVYVIMVFNIKSTAIVLKKCYLDINHWVNKIYIINKKSTLDYHLLSLKLTLITLHGWSIPLFLLFLYHLTHYLHEEVKVSTVTLQNTLDISKCYYIIERESLEF